MKAINNFERKRLDFCIKPAISRGGRDVYVINNKLKIMSFQNSREKHLNLKILKQAIKILKEKVSFIDGKIKNTCLRFRYFVQKWFFNKFSLQRRIIQLCQIVDILLLIIKN